MGSLAGFSRSQRTGASHAGCTRFAPALLLLALAGCAPTGTGRPIAAAGSPGPALRATCTTTDDRSSSRFDFHSSFWLNLHNYLTREARRARGVVDDGLLGAGNIALEMPASRPLTPEERVAWAAAVEHYIRRVAGVAHGDSVVIRVNNALARSSRGDLADTGIGAQTRSALLSVAEVYREVWWPEHDRLNRAWIAEARRALAEHERCLAPLLAETFGSRWPDGPIRVDATVYASWAAAYTTFDPPHITLSSVAVGSQGLFGLELLLHEAGHTIMRPLEAALSQALEENGRRGDARLAHMLLFYTAGNLVARSVPEYPTAAEAFGIWAQDARALEYRRLLLREWRPYLEGRRSLDEAMTALAAATPRSP